jgi:Helix-turn-helix domain
MKSEQCMTQTELAERWRISEATLERWRTESAGPLFLKLGNQVRYRLQDVEAFEEIALRGSTKIDGGVNQSAIPRPASQRPAAISRPARPITIWLRPGPQKTSLRPIVAGRQR